MQKRFQKFRELGNLTLFIDHGDDSKG